MSQNSRFNPSSQSIVSFCRNNLFYNVSSAFIKSGIPLVLHSTMDRDREKSMRGGWSLLPDFNQIRSGHDEGFSNTSRGSSHDIKKNRVFESKLRLVKAFVLCICAKFDLRMDQLLPPYYSFSPADLPLSLGPLQKLEAGSHDKETQNYVKARREELLAQRQRLPSIYPSFLIIFLKQSAIEEYSEFPT